MVKTPAKRAAPKRKPKPGKGRKAATKPTAAAIAKAEKAARWAEKKDEQARIWGPAVRVP
jgi:hypothetical protein